MSLGTRLTGVFSSPGDVFEEVKKGPPSTGNWLAPLVMWCLAGVLAACVMFSQDTVMQQIREQKERALQKKLAGLPKEQREQVMASAEKFTTPGLMATFGSIGSVLTNVGWLFGMAAVLWLLGKLVFKSSFLYMQAVEVCGLAAMITILNVLISMLLVVVMGYTVATPGPILLVREPSAANPAHLALSALNVITFWYLAVLSLGLAKLSGASAVKTALWLFGLWGVCRTGLIFLTLAAQRFS